MLWSGVPLAIYIHAHLVGLCCGLGSPWQSIYTHSFQWSGYAVVWGLPGNLYTRTSGRVMLWSGVPLEIYIHAHLVGLCCGLGSPWQSIYTHIWSGYAVVWGPPGNLYTRTSGRVMLWSGVPLAIYIHAHLVGLCCGLGSPWQLIYMHIWSGYVVVWGPPGNLYTCTSGRVMLWSGVSLAIDIHAHLVGLCCGLGSPWQLIYMHIWSGYVVVWGLPGNCPWRILGKAHYHQCVGCQV